VLAPTLTCAAPGRERTTSDVTIPCTAVDFRSGLADPAEERFTLQTDVAAGVETDSAVAGPRTICDRAGYCATAGPLRGLRVDRRGPTIVLTAPAAGGTYLAGAPLAADYACADAGSGLEACAGDVPHGGAIDTSRAGPASFTVLARDVAGNLARVISAFEVVTAPRSPEPRSSRLRFDSLDREGRVVRVRARIRPEAHGSVWVLVQGRVAGELLSRSRRLRIAEGRIRGNVQLSKRLARANRLTVVVTYAGDAGLKPGRIVRRVSA
jgi:hypothetical protein